MFPEGSIFSFFASVKIYLRRKKILICLRKTARVNFFYPFTRPEERRRFPFFPSPNLYTCFCYKILSCKSDNRISLLYSSTGYGRNILWEDTKDFSGRTNIRGRGEVAGCYRKFKTDLNNCQKKRFSGLPGNFHFAHAVFRKQSIFFGSPKITIFKSHYVRQDKSRISFFWASVCKSKVTISLT